MFLVSGKSAVGHFDPYSTTVFCSTLIQHQYAAFFSQWLWLVFRGASLNSRDVSRSDLAVVAECQPVDVHALGCTVETLDQFLKQPRQHLEQQILSYKLFRGI